MKKLHFVLAAAALLGATSCVNRGFGRIHFSEGGETSSTGEMTEQTREITAEYTALEATTGIDIIVSPNVPAGKIVVRAPQDDLVRVVTEVHDGTLKVGMKSKTMRKRNIVINYGNGNGTKIYVPVQNYSGLFASSSGSITLPEGYDAHGHVNIVVSSSGDVHLPVGFKAVSLAIQASSSGDVKGEATIEKGVSARASSSGDIELRGICTRPFEADASSSGDIDCGNFTCQTAQCSASSSGTVRIRVTERIDAHASSSGDIYWSGSATPGSISSSSSGSVRKI